MKIFITGATGFIGKNLVRRIEPKGHEIFCLVLKNDDVSVLETMNVKLVTGDVADFDRIEKLFSEIKPDIVFHCAGKILTSDQEFVNEDQGKFYEINVKGTKNICEACCSYSVKRLIYLSSASVIFENPDGLISDDMEYCTYNGYSKSKVEAECLIKNYRNKKLNSAIIRPTVVYGEDEPHMFNRILINVKRHSIFLPNVPGILCEMSLASVDNVVDVLELAMKKKVALEGTFIVADSETITMKRFFEILHDEMDCSKPKMIPRWLSTIILNIPFYRKREKVFLKNRRYDISRIKNILGYEPRIKTEAGLRQMVRYWKAKQNVSQSEELDSRHEN